MWQHLVEVALLGTEKKSLNHSTLPSEVQAHFNPTDTEPEHNLLVASALCHYYTETGREPQRAEGCIDESIIEETQEVAPPIYRDIYNRIDSTNLHFKESLLNYWLDSLIRKKLIIAPDGIVPLFNTAQNFADKTKAKIVEVIGNKGRWLLQFQSDFKYTQTNITPQAWDEGTTANRKEHLTHMLHSNPENAIDLLKSAWDQESLVNKRGYLEMLKAVPHKSIVEFAENLYKNEFSFNTKEKKTEKECRKILATILLSSEETELHQRTVHQLKKYFVGEKKKGFLGLGAAKIGLEYQLPSDEDSQFWNAANMEQAYGLEPKHYDISIFENINQSWLSFFIEYIPANAWQNELIQSHADLLNCFLNGTNFTVSTNEKKRPTLLHAFIQNATTRNNKQLALELLVRIPTTEGIPLLKHITPKEFEKYVRDRKYFADYEILLNGPYGVDESWPIEFSEYILANVFEQALHQGNLNTNALGTVMAQHLHTETYTLLQRLNEKAKDSNLYYSWSKNLYEPINSILQIRKLITTLNN
ncbi:MAG: hypothetical protein H6536_04895 [Bacteroidales bacterium]|nr:hypothetical protein [Bacteroidales bacterium]